MRQGSVDALVAGAVLLFVSAVTLPAFAGQFGAAPLRSMVEILLMLTACGALYWRRRRPVLVGMTVIVAVFAYYLTSSSDGPLLVAVVVALYSIAEQGRLAAAAAQAAVVLLATYAGTLAGNEDFNVVGLFLLGGWLIAIVALGWARHSRIAFAQEVRRRAADEERLRIARDVHDAIGHHLSAINVQAASALYRSSSDGNPQTDALSAIKASSAEALRELRTTLRALRAADEQAPTEPAPGMARIGDLVAGSRAAGVSVTLETPADTRPLPLEVDLAVYRIVQESLTNVARHAQAKQAMVRIERDAGEVRVEVIDDGGVRSGNRAGNGTGLVGMTERAEALGGTLTAGPRHGGGGFAVRARLPLDPAGPPQRPAATDFSR